MKSILFFTTLLMTGNSLASTFPEKRSYSHHFFRTEQECRDAQPGGIWVNCHQTLDFNPEGRAFVMVTDIMNYATYSIEQDRVVVKKDGPGDMPEEMIFRMDHSQRNLVSEGDRLLIWELQ